MEPFDFYEWPDQSNGGGGLPQQMTFPGQAGAGEKLRSPRNMSIGIVPALFGVYYCEIAVTLELTYYPRWVAMLWWCCACGQAHHNQQQHSLITDSNVWSTQQLCNPSKRQWVRRFSHVFHSWHSHTCKTLWARVSRGHGYHGIYT